MTIFSASFFKQLFSVFATMYIHNFYFYFFDHENTKNPHSKVAYLSFYETAQSAQTKKVQG